MARRLCSALAAVISISCLFLFPLPAEANLGATGSFQCQDRDALARLLSQLDIQCRQTPIVCSAMEHKGSTAEIAVEMCVKDGISFKSCAQNVSCGEQKLCSSQTYRGTTLDDAINACLKTGMPIGNCARSADCPETQRICWAMGHAGSSVESAIDHCSRGGNDTAACSRNVSCNDRTGQAWQFRSTTTNR